MESDDFLDPDLLEFESDDSFLCFNGDYQMEKRAEDDVCKIFKQWKLNAKTSHSPQPTHTLYSDAKFDSRTFTRPKKKFNSGESAPAFTVAALANDDCNPSMESGISSINLLIGGAISLSPASYMQRSWLQDVSPPGSIGTSMTFQENEKMCNSLITSSDFTNISYLLNNDDDCKDALIYQDLENIELFRDMVPSQVTNPSQNLDGTFNILNKTVTNNNVNINSSSFSVKKPHLVEADECPQPHKEYSLENQTFDLKMENLDFDEEENIIDQQEQAEKNLTFNKYQNRSNFQNATFTAAESPIPNGNISYIQSTPVLSTVSNLKSNIDFDIISPITHSPRSSQKPINSSNIVNHNTFSRSSKSSRKLISDITISLRNSTDDDQSEDILVNDDTVIHADSNEKTFDCMESNEKEFDKMLEENFSDLKNSVDSDKLLQSVDTIKQRHSIINLEKQREDLRKREIISEHVINDNKLQYEGTMNKSSERLLNRRSRLYDDVNLQIALNQKQDQDIQDQHIVQDNDQNEEVIDKSNRDRFKTIRLNKKPYDGMVSVVSVVSDEKVQQSEFEPEKKPEFFKRPVPSGLSKFGFTRPASYARSDLKLTLKASSIDNLDDKKPNPRALKSPMGVKAHSYSNLVFSNTDKNQMRVGNSKLIPPAAAQNADQKRILSNLRMPRATSLVRTTGDNNRNLNSAISNPQMRPPTRKAAVGVRPSSGYYSYNNAPSAKRNDSDTESGRFSPNSLSSSSASSRGSVYMSSNIDQQMPKHSIEDISIQNPVLLNGTTKKQSGLRQPSNLRPPSNLRAPMSTYVKR